MYPYSIYIKKGYALFYVEGDASDLSWGRKEEKKKDFSGVDTSLLLLRLCLPRVTAPRLTALYFY